MWLYNNEVFDTIPEGMIGYVYIITNNINNRKYIGKKNFYFTKTRQVKGKKKRSKVESNWHQYYGSNKELLEDVEKFGKEHFKREILILCKSKGDFAYHEARLQFENRVLESNDWYNSWLMCRIHKKHLTFGKQ